MTMDRDTLWREYTALSPEAQQLVEEIITFLATQATTRPAPPPRPKGPLAEDPAIGMWRDREDMADSVAWVRAVREREWTRQRG
jgi:hypothetical protein